MFFLGTGEPSWLARTSAPLFVSHRRFSRLKKLPRALGPWALDSGGFTEVSTHGRWVTTPTEYADAVARYVVEVGRMEWCAPQDWMCEPWIIQKTGKSVREHQDLTVENFLRLRDELVGIRVVPVLQGFAEEEYHACADLYASAGVDLTRYDVVGIGSVCRRQGTDEATRIVRSVSARGIALHGFGFKVTGLRKCYPDLRSSDSMSWSFTARRQQIQLAGCGHPRCQNCIKYAHKWRADLVGTLERDFGSWLTEAKGDHHQHARVGF